MVERAFPYNYGSVGPRNARNDFEGAGDGVPLRSPYVKNCLLGLKMTKNYFVLQTNDPPETDPAA